jgi:hypothetical protein
VRTTNKAPPILARSRGEWVRSRRFSAPMQAHHGTWWWDQIATCTSASAPTSCGLTWTTARRACGWRASRVQWCALYNKRSSCPWPPSMVYLSVSCNPQGV